jgi:hypothetical protein
LVSTNDTSRPDTGGELKRIKRCADVTLAALLFVCWTAPCFAAETAFREVFQDALYGGLGGGLVGAAVMAFTKRPGDHLEYLGVGAAVGVLAGTTYGVVKTSRSLVEMNDGKVKFAMPTIRPDIKETSARGLASIGLVAEVFRGKF